MTDLDWGDWGKFATHPQDCPNAPHRGPEGPCEDLSQCSLCLAPSWSMRPEGEVYGRHAVDCSLPERHEGVCAPGGQGHPEPAVLRGYPEDWTWESVPR